MGLLYILFFLSTPFYIYLYLESKNESCSVMNDSLPPHRHSPWNSWDQNTGVGGLSLHQGIFPTQGSNPGLQHRRWIFLSAEPQEKPNLYLIFVLFLSLSILSPSFIVLYNERFSRQQYWSVLPSPSSVDHVLSAMKLKDACSLEEKLWQT